MWNPAPQHPPQNPTYPCPICRRGQLDRLELMEAYGCNHCGNLVDVDPRSQIARTLSTAPGQSYHWQRDRWLPTYRRDLRLSPLAVVSLLAFTLLPTAIAALAVYIFPPLAGSRGAWIPYTWVVSVAVAHVGSALWLLAECYQWPTSTQSTQLVESRRFGRT